MIMLEIIHLKHYFHYLYKNHLADTRHIIIYLMVSKHNQYLFYLIQDRQG